MDEKSISSGELPPPTIVQRKEIGSMWTRPMRIAIAALLALFFLLAHTRLALEPETDSEGRLVRPGHSGHASKDTGEWKVPLDVHIM
jgi:hypothetical protein